MKKKVTKAVAFGLVVFLVNVLGTTSYMVFGLMAATTCAREFSMHATIFPVSVLDVYVRTVWIG
jgi:hypothetical protein